MVTITRRIRCGYVIAHLHRLVSYTQFDQILMELCPCGSVNDMMVVTGKTLNEAQVAFVCKQILQALAYMAANNKLHRDIKPHNMLVNHRGETKLGMVKVK